MKIGQIFSSVNYPVQTLVKFTYKWKHFR